MTARPTADASDLFDLGADLDEQEQLVAESIHRFVRERVLPDIRRHFEACTFPVELAPEIGTLGLFGMHLDGYGGAGTNATSYDHTLGRAITGLEAFR